ncbi:MAG: AMP-binding protein [Muribaculaceae bacterium]|nr:AMP-binding protein [Muribaculaceae bacterium]
MNRTVFSKLIKLHIITPGGLCTLFGSFIRDGISLMALMRFSAKYYPDRCALVTDSQRLTYKEIYDHSQRLAKLLYRDYELKTGMCVGLLCRNHIIMALLLPALSRLGVRVKLLNTDIAPIKLREQVERNKINLLIYDSELKEQRVPTDLPCKMRESEDLFRKIIENTQHINVKLPRIRRGGDISVFTGGSCGRSKEAPRRMSVGQFLPPFYALLDQLHLDEFNSVFLSLPVYHGFGLATLIMSFVMGKKVCLMSHFDADKAIKIIANEKIEVVPVVPAMLARFWQNGEAPTLMKTVKCIISGGDRLDKKWANATREHLGNVLYNLFGTSEAGFFMIASPDDLARNEEVPIGKPIRGVKCKVENIDSHGIGSLWVRSGWAMISLKNKWQDTGDLVYRNSEGCYFYRGRSDNMVVCGGENVFPENVEKAINAHDEVVTSIVFPATDLQFGTVLNAKVELTPDSTLTANTLKAWLHTRLTRAEMPHDITINTISTLDSGKIARNQSH